MSGFKLENLNKKQLINLINCYSDYIEKNSKRFGLFNINEYFKKDYETDRKKDYDTDILNKIYNIIYKKDKYDYIDMDTDILEDLWIDELDLVEVICEIEKVFKININDEDVDNMKTIEDLYNIIIKKYKGDKI